MPVASSSALPGAWPQRVPLGPLALSAERSWVASWVVSTVIVAREGDAG